MEPLVPREQHRVIQYCMSYFWSRNAGHEAGCFDPAVWISRSGYTNSIPNLRTGKLCTTSQFDAGFTKVMAQDWRGPDSAIRLTAAKLARKLTYHECNSSDTLQCLVLPAGYMDFVPVLDNAISADAAQ